MTVLEKRLSEHTCPYATQCGGCSLWHLDDDAYDLLKKEIALNIVKQLDTASSCLQETVKIRQHERRRADLKISVNKGDITLGFFAAKSHDVVGIDMCLIMDKKINHFLVSLKETLYQLKKPGNIYAVNVTALDQGLDIIFTTKNELIKRDQAVLAKLSENKDVLRASWHLKDVREYHCLYDSEKATITFGQATIALPIGAFLQASEKAQHKMTELICESLQDNTHILDLFSGCGTYSFPLLANDKMVTAYEGNADMVTAMSNALRHEDLESKGEARRRDLFKKPLDQRLLEPFEAAVINPPRAGAKAQTIELAKSNLEKIVMVSCNPETFLRDAKTLLKNNYKLTSLTPIDQFYRSNHLELLGVFKQS